ncbi:MAG: T9SS type A sorting domain-containing protein [Ignavibacteriae bacterium]|nr:T9SS type A sorting domain-containing protein [Ignavibacteriota bacterium]MCB9210659.1 T9SS type A sorting domain-containing protein [Ignavibacteriales bacterium]MCB9259992.1 T9SS type A sorting domain-containing protein [Ignavibacteriales bacterium]
MKQMLAFLTFLLLSVFIFQNNLYAQEYDYLDVAPGYETLNLAISGDTTATGDPVSENRVYRLKRGDVYLLNGTIENVGSSTLRIFAEEGDGPRPMIMATADDAGTSYRPFAPTADAHFMNIYISGRNNLGIYTDDSKDMLRLQDEGITLTLDGCFLEHEWKDFVRMNADSQTVIIKNSILRNAGDLADGSDNQFIDTRSNKQELIMAQNSTFHTSTGRGFRTGGGSFFKNFVLDHCTFYQIGNGDGARGAVDFEETPLFSVERAQNVSVTNCLFMDVVFHGDEINTYEVDDTLDYPIFGFLSLDDPEIPDDTRNIVVRNNAHGTTQALLDYYASVDTVKPPVLLNSYSINTFFNKYPQTWIQENNFNENVVFTDAPSPDPVVAYASYRRANDFTEENVPEFWADRNGIGEDPSTWGPAENEYDFSYNTSSAAYTAGDGGSPLGDLNWWPEWITDVNNNSNVIPTEFSLEQNYPNPFNPSTIISYNLPKASKVSLEVFNILGQKVITIVDNLVQNIGTHKVVWRGKDQNGNSLSSGTYFYRLSADNNIITKKMLLLK